MNAEHQQTLAEEAQKKAEQQRLVAETERTRAVQAQAQAEASFERTMKTIKSLADLGRTLRGQPGQQAVSKQLLDETLRLYDELAKEQGDNPAIRRQRIMALAFAGEIRSTLRETDRAEELLKQAAELVEVEIQSSPSDFGLHHRATAVYWYLGVLYKDSGRPQESLESFRRYLVAIEVLVKNYPGNVGFLINKANVLTNICNVLINLGKPHDALPHYDEAISILRGVLQASPDHAGARNELALVLHDYSSLLRQLGRIEPAETTFREAFDLRQQLFKSAPKDVANRTFLARLYSSQGFVERDARRYEASIAQFQQAIDLAQSLVEDFPDIYEYQRIIIGHMIDQLTTCQLAKNAEIGKPLWQRLSNRLQIAFDKFPKDKYVVAKVADWQYHWADQLWEDGQQPQATPIAKSALQAAVLVLTLLPTMKPAEEATSSNSAAWHLAVVVDPSLRDIKKSIDLARRATELAPNNSYILHTLGTALYYDGDYTGAREQLLKGILFEQSAPKRGTIEQLLGALRALPKDPDAARNELDALGLKKSSPHVMSLYYSMLSMTLWKLGEQDAARDILRLVVDPPAEFSKDGPETRRLIGEARALVRPE